MFEEAGFVGILGEALPLAEVFPLDDAGAIVVELLNELGTKGELPTVVESLLAEGGGVRPRD